MDFAKVHIAQWETPKFRIRCAKFLTHITFVAVVQFVFLTWRIQF